jgi:hypothetical protein
MFGTIGGDRFEEVVVLKAPLVLTYLYLAVESIINLPSLARE